MLVHRLTPAHLAEYRAFMLQAYANDPRAFQATVEERESLPLEWWASRVAAEPDASEMVFGAFDDSRLVGVAGLKRHGRPRTRHKATLYGMAVLPELRGRGIARILVEAALDHARSTPDIRLIQLTVMESNGPGRRLYESCGFEVFGVEPDAVAMGERLVPLVHMWHPLR